MLKIKFSQVWDKLDRQDRFKVGNNFTTFRGYEVRKHQWYRTNVGKIFDVMVKGNKIGKAKLLSVTVRWSNKLRVDEIQRDTYSHYIIDDFDKLMIEMYGNSCFVGLWLTFQITEVDMPITSIKF